MSIGSRLAELRKARGWTQSRLAQESNLSASTIAMYETNRRSPDATAVTKLAAALEVPRSTFEELPASTTQTSAPGKDKTRAPQNAKAKATELGQSPKSTQSTQSTQSPKNVQRVQPSIGQPAATQGADVQASFGTTNPAANPTGGTNLPTFSLTREEARIILFLRMNKECLPFLEAYVSAEASKRRQMEETWRLIHEFQA